MDLAVTPAVDAGGAARLRVVRDWWRVRRPGPTIGQRLDLLYTIAISVGILGALAYGTASSALSQVVSPDWLAHFGPSLALAALLVTARWGAYQGPVVFSVPDVAHLLGAPLPRGGLAVGRIRSALVAGAVAGAVAAGVVIVGLAGDGRGIAVGRATGMVLGLAELGVLGVACAWTVERSARWDRTTLRLIWPAAAVAVALAAASGAGHVGREVALWAGPWGWAVQPGTPSAAWPVALVLLSALVAVATADALRRAGDCPAERHMRRAEARAGAMAGLMSFDARSARRALEAAGTGGHGRSAGDLPRLRRLVGRRGVTGTIVWRDLVAARRAPGRVVEATVLVGAGAGLTLANAEHVVSAAAGMLLVYAGAARMLWPMRAELDVPARTRVLLRSRAGLVIGAHARVPMVVVALATALAAAVCAVAGGLPDHGALAAVVAIVAAPVVTACAGMSARRGGQIPESVFAVGSGTDPSGGGFAIVFWLAIWPALGAVLGAGPVIVAAHGGGQGALLAALAALAVGGGLLGTLARDPED